MPGDGNCLFHALSVAMAGNLSLSAELRVRVGIEMAINKTSYLKKHRDSGLKLVSPSYSEAQKDCLRDGSYSSAWTIDAAATVLGTKIVSVYPPVNGLMDKAFPILNRTFHPNNVAKTASPSIFIMWTSMCRPRQSTIWTPNHLSPLLMVRGPEVINVCGVNNMSTSKKEVNSCSLDSEIMLPLNTW